MKNSILIIILSILFGFSNISLYLQNGRSFWETYFTRQVNMLFAFSPNSGPQKQDQTTDKISLYENWDK